MVIRMNCIRYWFMLSLCAVVLSCQERKEGNTDGHRPSDEHLQAIERLKESARKRPLDVETAKSVLSLLGERAEDAMSVTLRDAAAEIVRDNRDAMKPYAEDYATLDVPKNLKDLEKRAALEQI